MATDLFFSPPVPQKPVSGINQEKIGPSDAAHPNKIKTKKDTKKTDGESFLSTLKRVSQNTNRTETSDHISRAKHTKTKTSPLKGKTDKTAEPTAEQKEDVPSLAPQPECTITEESGLTSDSGGMPVIRNFMDFIKALEDLGFYNSDGGFAGKYLTDGESADGKDIAALKLMLTRLQQNGLVSATELKAAFERLQQFITKALGGNTPPLVGGSSGNSQSADLQQQSARFLKWLKALVADANHQGNNTGTGKEEGIPGAELSGSMSSDAKGSAEPSATFIDPTVNAKVGDSFQAIEKAGGRSQAVSSSAAESEKGAFEKIPSSAQLNETPKEPAVSGKTDADASKLKSAPDFESDNKIARRIETAPQMMPDKEAKSPNTVERFPDNQPAKQSSPAELKSESGNPSNGFGQATAGEEPVSRVLQDIQAVKDGDVKVSSGKNEETAGKVIKIEAGTNDSGLLNSQNHPMEKPADTATLPKEADPDRSGLKTQTMDQIVQKAAIHLKNGQHEARIDLKPEYLGHIRMQIVSDNHQVTVKILAEHGFVKDMIENNAHQLKSDLQQQGLNIDKLEVTVSRDSDDSGNSKERLAGMRTRQGAADGSRQGNPGQGSLKDHRQPRRSPVGTTKVDYFA